MDTIGIAVRYLL